MVLLTGSYSPAQRPGIYLHNWHESSNTFSLGGVISGLHNPSYLCVLEKKALIHAITENKEGDASWLHIYQLNEFGEALRTTSIPFLGAGSCFVSVEKEGKHAFVTNYGAGTLSVLRLPMNESPGTLVQEIRFEGSGPDPERQTQPHPHAALLSADQQYLYCTDLGTDRLYTFNYLQNQTRPLNGKNHNYIQLPPGSGPRHLALSANGRFLYLITELTAEIFVFDVSSPMETWIQRVSLAPPDDEGKREGGDIQITDDGCFLYASNRGDLNEIIVFAIDSLDGRLTFLQRTSAVGSSPRCLLICKKQGLLLAANEKSDNITIYNLQADGRLAFTGQQLHIPAPACLKAMN